MALVPCLLRILDLGFSGPFGNAGEWSGTWREVPPGGLGDSYSPCFPPHKELCISN